MLKPQALKISINRLLTIGINYRKTWNQYSFKGYYAFDPYRHITVNGGVAICY